MSAPPAGRWRRSWTSRWGCKSDADLAYERGIARDRALHRRTLAEAQTTWRDWLTEELPHLAADRPWERADLVVAGTDVAVTHGEKDLIVAAHSSLLAN